MSVWFQKNLEGGVYTEIKQFAADVRQVFSNCYRYNVSNNKLVKVARDLQVSFDAQLNCCLVVSLEWDVLCKPSSSELLLE